MRVDVADLGTARRRDGVPVRGVGPGVGEHVEAVAEELAVLCGPGPRRHGKGVAHAGAEHTFLAGQFHAHGRAVELHGQEGHDGLQHHILFVAEPAADVRLDDPDGRPRDAERLPDHAAADVRDLRGADDHDMPHVVHVGVGRLVFQMAMLHGRRAVGALNHHVGGRKGFVERAVAFEGVLLEQVAVGIYGGLEHGRTGSQRRFRRGHDREGLIFDFDQMGGLAGGEAVAGHDHGHFVAVIADVLGQQKAVGHVSVRRVHGVGMSGCGKEEARHVIGGEDGLDAGQGQRFRGIDGKDHAVGDGAVHIGGVPHTRQAHIVGIPGPPRHFGFGIQPLFGLSDCHAASPVLLV